MPTPPPNVPFEVSDEELEAELARFSADAPATPAAAPTPRPNVPAPLASERSPSAAAPMPAPSVAADDMFSGLDQSPKQPVRPMALGELPQRTSSSAPKYILLFAGVVIVLGGLGFLFWEFAIRRPAAERAANVPQLVPAVAQPTIPPTSPSVPAPVVPDPVPTVVPDPTLPSQGSNDVPAPLPTPVVTPPPGTTIPFPEQVSPLPQQPASASVVDTDEDGLSDSRELELGTDPRNRDTDADELSDGDEVLKYGTNPLDRDTDKDSFLDGKEVQNGYNPRGSDKCAKSDCSV